MTLEAGAPHEKPLDFGADGVCGSLDRSGRPIALSFYHPQQGYITLTSADPFPEAERYNPAAVRAFRARLADLEGFGLRFDKPLIRREASLLENVVPQHQLVFEGGGSAQIITLADSGGALQWCRVEGVSARWQGRFSLQRCAYTQLTEGGPIPAPAVEMKADFDGGLLILENPALGAVVAVAGLAGDELHLAENGALTLDLPLRASTLAYGVGQIRDEAIYHARRLFNENPALLLENQQALWRERWRHVPAEPLVRRGLAYGLMMCVPASEGVCILTDHMLLPLSWNRDAYYVARALLSWQPEMAEKVRQHLLWMFETADRPDGAWGRCYLANGRIKDGAFQLDQQLFPLLELADYTLTTGDSALIKRLRQQIDAVIEALLRRKAPDAALFPTDETPADDPIALPYHLSSHILFWHTLRRLHAAQLGEYSPLAEAIRRSIDEHFIAIHENGNQLYAYATDGHGRHHFYHDANDLPLVLAVKWGMIGAEDPVWRATVDFAFSDANLGGAYHGRLGSVHTRAPWPLGDVQAWIIAQTMQDAGAEKQAWDFLRAAAQHDGALPEAYHPETRQVFSRHWFAWPNAALACAVLGAFDV